MSPSTRKQVRIDTTSEKSPLLPSSVSRSPRSPPSSSSSSSSSSSATATASSNSPNGLYLLILLAAVTQGIRATIIHGTLTQTPLPTSSTLVTYSLVFTPVSLLLISLGRIPFPGPQQLSQLFIRAILSGLLFYVNAYSLSLLPVGVAVTLFGTAPVITSLLSAVFLHDKLEPKNLLCLLVNAIGVLLVAKPHGSVSILGIFCALASASLQASAFTLVRYMGTRVHFVHNILAIGLGCLMILPFVGVHDALHGLTQSIIGTRFAILAAFAAFTAQSLLNHAMRKVRAGIGVAVLSVNVPTAFILGVVFMGEHPDLLGIVGATLVLSSVVFMAFLK